MSDPGPTARQDRPVTLRAFNRLPATEAAYLLRGCLDVERWVDGLVMCRPYNGIDDLFEAGREIAFPFEGHEVRHAVAGRDAGPLWAGFAVDGTPGWRSSRELQQRFQANEAAYARRFGQPFVIRAAGRSAQEVADHLERRLLNDPADEDREVGQQLRQLALLALGHCVIPG